MMPYRVPDTGGLAAFSATIPGRVVIAAIIANVMIVLFFLIRLLEWADWSIGIWGLLFALVHLLSIPIVLFSCIFILGHGRIGTALSITAVCTGITFIVLIFQDYSGDSEALRPLFILPVLVAVTVILAIFDFQKKGTMQAARSTIEVPIVPAPTGLWPHFAETWPYLAGGYVVSAAYYIAIHGATFDFSLDLLFEWLGGGCVYWAIGVLSLRFTKTRSKGHAIALVICVILILALLGNFLPDR